MVEKAKKEVEVIIRDEGEAATFETGVNGLHPEIVRLLGKLKYRTHPIHKSSFIVGALNPT